MKVGSIVECVNVSNITPREGYINIKPGNIYTVREINAVQGLTFILLEEIVNPPGWCIGNEFREPGWFISRFRELLPPMEIQSALDSCEPVLIKITSTPLSK